MTKYASVPHAPGALRPRLLGALRRLLAEPDGSGRRARSALRVLLLGAVKFRRDVCFQRAAGLAFSTIISLIPLAVLFFSFAGLLGGGDRIIAWVRTQVFPLVAPDFQEDLGVWLDTYISTTAFRGGSAGIVSASAIFGLLLTAFGVMAMAERSLNLIFQSRVRRRWIQKMSAFWVILTVSPFLIALAIWLGEVVMPPGGLVERLHDRSWLLRRVGGFVVPVIVGFASFTTLFAVLPASRVRFHSAATGGLVAAVLWEVSRRAFFLYVGHAATITGFYPKLAALPLFLIWIWINWVIVLFGAEVASVHQNPASARTTPPVATRRSGIATALALLESLKADFRAGTPPRALRDAAARLDLDQRTAERVAAGLVAGGILIEDARRPGVFSLSVAPERIALRDVAERLLQSEFPDDFVSGGAEPAAGSSDTGGRGVATAWQAFLDALDGRPAAEPPAPRDGADRPS